MAQRDALIASLARSLVLHEQIETTLMKAKELRPFVERLITKGKVKSVATMRHVRESLNSETGAKKILDTLGPKYATRNGGYTRIIKSGRRVSDGAEKAIIEFV